MPQHIPTPPDESLANASLTERIFQLARDMLVHEREWIKWWRGKRETRPAFLPPTILRVSSRYWEPTDNAALNQEGER